MSNSDLHRLGSIDQLIKHNLSFALYRLPFDNRLTLVIQQQNQPLLLNDLSQLNGQAGFVIAPFSNSGTTPIICIKPDKVITGEQAIVEYLSSITLVANHQSTVFERRPDYGFAKYQQIFDKFRQTLLQGQFEKLVLSRYLQIDCDAQLSPGQLFVQACQNYPSAFIYLLHTPQSGSWFGCSPEQLLSGKGQQWHTVALAGTRIAECQQWDEKNKQEQALVADYVRQCLARVSADFQERGPYTVRAGKLSHLKTEFDFRLTDNQHLGDILKQLHPTPAVCGLPKMAAYQFLLQNEAYDRSYYAGFVGYLAPEQQTDLYVNLRCMTIGSKRLTLFAGGGLLPSSELQSEWQETEQKLHTMLSLLQSSTP